MVSDGIKAARIKAQYSPLINSTWGASAFPTAILMAVIKHAADRLHLHRSSRKPVGKHAAPGRPRFSRHTSQ